MVEVQSKDGFPIASEGILGKKRRNGKSGFLGPQPHRLSKGPQPQPCDTTSIAVTDPRSNNSQKCPSCGSIHICKNGMRTLGNGSETQRLKCGDCGRKFSENYIRCLGQHGHANYALVQEAKKLDAVTETKTVTDDMKGRIVEYCFNMQKQGYAEATIRLTHTALKVLMDRGADLADPENVKEVIAQQTWSGNRRRNVINAYTQFLTYLGLTWEKPRYNIVRKLPFIPTEQEIDDLIAGSPPLLAVFLQLLKETAMRRGEAIVLPWKDVDLERRIIMCNYPEKGSNPRIFSDVSGKLLSMLNTLPKNNNGLVFGTSTIQSMKNYLIRTRRRLAFKLGNPRLKDIHFHTLRYWKGTMLYHYKPDILIVAEFLGHKNIENTRLYIQLEKNLFKNLPNDMFITRIANNAE